MAAPNYKVLVVEKDGVELPFHEELPLKAENISFDNTGTGLTAEDVKNAILEAAAPQVETDPVFTASQAANIDAEDITNLSNLSGVNSGDQVASDFAHNDLNGLNAGTVYQHITATQETNFESAYTHSQIVTGNPHDLSLNDLTDVVSISPIDGHLIRWNPSTNRWENSSELRHRTYRPLTKFLTTANQTTQMLDTDEYVYVLLGSTLGQILDLPDATTLNIGHQFWVMNESTVKMTLRSFGGSNEESINPYSNIRRVLIDNSTPAGVWSSSVGQNFAVGKLRDPRIFSMNGTMGNGDWVSISNLLSDYKYIFGENAKLIGMEWSNGSGDNRSFDLIFYKNGTGSGNIVRTYQVRNSDESYGFATGWDNLFAPGDYMRVKYVDRGLNCSDFGGRFNFEVV